MTISTLAVWPASGSALTLDDGVTVVPSGGAALTYTAEIRRRLTIDGTLLTYDPSEDPVTWPDTPVSPVDAGEVIAAATDLDTRRGSYDGQPVVASYRTTQGDGGGGLFEWRPTSTATRDAGAIYGTYGTGRWERIYSGDYLDPAWYGAKGDDATNDTTALRACVAALSTSSARGVDFGTRKYYLGTRTGATDSDYYLSLTGLSNRSMIASGAQFRFETTYATPGYAPEVFHITGCTDLHFVGHFAFRDSKAVSLYAIYGGTGTGVSTNTHLYGMAAVMLYESNVNVTFDSLSFYNCGYGVAVTNTGAVPTGTSRSRQITVSRLRAHDTLYPLLCAENGDDLHAPSVTTYGCGRPVFLYGMSNAKISANVTNSLVGLKSSITRKKRDTTNIDLTIMYKSDDNWPYIPLQLSLEPEAGTGDPYIRGVKVRMTCSLTGSYAGQGDRQACVHLTCYDTAGVASNFTVQSAAMLDGIVLDIDKGEFEHYVDCSPTGDTTTNYRKVPVTLIPRARIGGTYSVPATGVDATLYQSAKKLAFVQPHIYEFCSSDTVHAASVVYPVSGWAPMKNDALASMTGETLTWRWTRIGALVHYEFHAVVVTVAASLPTGNFYFQMPYLPALEGGSYPAQQELGQALVTDVSTGDLYTGVLYYSGGSVYPLLAIRQGVTGYVDSFSAFTKSSHFTLTTGDKIHINCTYHVGSSF